MSARNRKARREATAMSPTVLYIDSDAATRRLVTRVLVPAGVRVLEAATLAQAQQIASQTRPDVAIVDVDAASGDGDEIVRLLRQGPQGPGPGRLPRAAARAPPAPPP